jgi:hypothetical protein
MKIVPLAGATLEIARRKGVTQVRGDPPGERV